MRAGKLRHVVTIQQPIKTNNAINEAVIDWQVFARDIRANLLPLGSKEFFAQDKEKSSITHKLFIRYIEGVTNQMRIIMGARIFEIVAPPINVDEMDRELVIMVKENG